MSNVAIESLYTSKDQQYYSMERAAIVELVPFGTKTVLDIGCGSGVLGKLLKQTKRASEVYGIELNPDAANQAEKNLEKVFQGNIESWKPDIEPNSVDVIVMADVVEHLIDPWKALKDISAFLKPSGLFIASIPNVRCWRILIPLIFKDEWTYSDWGLLDKGHLRFFTQKSVIELFEKSGYTVKNVKIDLPLSSFSGKLNLLTFGLLKKFLTSHTIICAEKKT